MVYFEGNSNMIFTAPHGGRNYFQKNAFDNQTGITQNEAPKCRCEINCSLCEKEKIVTVLDRNTAEISLIIHKNFSLFQNQGSKHETILPHMLISFTSRQQVELNREKCQNGQCESIMIQELDWIYEFYHQKIRNIITFNKNLFKNNLLVDIHGMSSKQKFT